jgi:hypothetical protein
LRSLLNKDVPAFICPLSKEIFSDPVILSDGHSYEKEAIIQWLKTHSVSPVTGIPLQSRSMIPNNALKQAISHFFGTQPAPQPAPAPAPVHPKRNLYDTIYGHHLPEIEELEISQEQKNALTLTAHNTIHGHFTLQFSPTAKDIQHRLQKLSIR